MSTILGGTIMSSTKFANFDSATCLKKINRSGKIMGKIIDRI